MTDEGMAWAEPLTPWNIVQRRFFAGQAPDAVTFSRKHNLEETAVRQTFSGEQTIFSPEFSVALSRETGMSEQFFVNLNDRHQQAMRR